MRIIAGRLRGRKLEAPEGEAVRPTSDRAREALFNVLVHGGYRAGGGSAVEGALVLDAFCGTGALGLEALSRGAAHVTFVDTGAEARGLIRDHIEAFGAGGVAKLLRRDATALGPAGTLGPVDLVFLDPPYGQGLGERALVSLRDNGWLQADTLLVLEESADAAVTLPAGFVLDDRRDYGAAAIYVIIPA